MARKKLSRAKWKGSFYFRKRTDDWRLKRSGRVFPDRSGKPGKNVVRVERTYDHPYGGGRHVGERFDERRKRFVSVRKHSRKGRLVRRHRRRR